VRAPCLKQMSALPFAAMPKIICEQIEQWLQDHRVNTEALQRPQVTLCYAQSWDGSLALSPGESLALSNPQSMRLTHRLRSMHDGILVGIGTVLADDPQLTVRECSGQSPQPIVLDSQLRMPSNSRLSLSPGRQCWVLTSPEHARAEREGVDLIGIAKGEDGALDLNLAMQALWQRGIRSVMVEGGAQVISAFVRARLADAIVLTVAPTLVGGYKAVGELGIHNSAQLPRIAPLHTERLDDDLIMWGNLHYPEEAC
jgi:diaminohydroxyphosphoribosylaminopyrimidine deaminase/5-amino-6-(5-phosphoribosylamino)uracil reductase